MSLDHKKIENEKIDHEKTNNLGQIKTISQTIECNADPIDVLDDLTQSFNLSNTMLLESSEIESKKDLKSIMMLSAALRIECHGENIEVKALTKNGENALDFIKTSLQKTNPSIIKNIKKKPFILSLTYKQSESFMDEDSKLKSQSSLDILRLIQSQFKSNSHHEYSIFICGVFAFDFIATFEKLKSLPTQDNTCPDFVFYLAESLLVINHANNNQRLYANHFSGKDDQKTYYELARNIEKLSSTIKNIKSKKTNQKNDSQKKPSINVDINEENFKNKIKQLKDNINKGDIFQVVPSRTFSVECKSTINSYKALKQRNPSPYLFFMNDENFSLFGASPESALKYSHSDNSVLLYPIAGTRPRGKTEDNILDLDLDLDARIEAELKLDEKELAEHMMLVDLARNDIARISKTGTTHVPRLLSVDKYSQVMHLVSCVKGVLREDLDALHAYRACMNMGTLTGAPKIKASELIQKVEQKRRGSYGGAIGYLNGLGDMDTCIVIRSAFCHSGTAYIQAGAGVVYDSDPLSEALETQNKAQAVIDAIVTANQIEV